MEALQRTGRSAHATVKTACVICSITPAICNLDLDDALEILEEADEIDLPKGCGRI
jgi:hypothetical protein